MSVKVPDTMPVKRGEIYYADLSPVVGSEQGGIRPVLIVQNDIGNKHSPTVIAAAITSQKDKARLPTHIDLDASHCGLARDSVVLLEQIRTIDKRRLKERMGELDAAVMYKVNQALSISFGLGNTVTAPPSRVTTPAARPNVRRPVHSHTRHEEYPPQLAASVAAPSGITVGMAPPSEFVSQRTGQSENGGNSEKREVTAPAMFSSDDVPPVNSGGF